MRCAFVFFRTNWQLLITRDPHTFGDLIIWIGPFAWFFSWSNPASSDE